MQHLVAVMITDLVGSTAIRTAAGDATATPLIGRAEELQRAAVAAAGGVVTLGTGDGVIATFESSTAALETLLSAAQEVLELGIEIRGVVDVGDVGWDDGRPTGPTLTRVRALIDALDGNELLCTTTAAATVVTGGFRFDSGPTPELVVPTLLADRTPSGR